MEAADCTLHPLRSDRPSPATPRSIRKKLRRRSAVWAAALGALLTAGCRLPPPGDGWPNAERTPNRVIREGNPDLYPLWSERFAPRDELFQAETWARAAAALEQNADCGCVDAYYRATTLAWTAAWRPVHRCVEASEPERARKLYHACLAKLIATGQKFERLDPRSGLRLKRGDGEEVVPVTHEGFAWQPEDFNHLELVGEYRDSDIPPVRWCGWGVPLVAERRRCDPGPFFRHKHGFAATAMLVPQEDHGESAAPVAPAPTPIGGSDAVPIAPTTAVRRRERFALRLVNPSTTDKIDAACGVLPLAGDLSAPLALFGAGADRDYVTGFLRPDRNQGNVKLIMLHPYERGKIPVVLVHGLLSDPATWIPATNALLREKRFRDRYQIWAFRYPTGQAFLLSAADFRRSLSEAAATAPGAADDPARMHTVLIGHSMGGLISKLQVLSSGEAFWNLASNVPLDELVASDEDREHLRQIFYFEPRPDVRRVVYIGTPQRGASSASRLAGKTLSALVRTSSEADARQRRLTADNPGAFKMGIERRIPNSVDLLEPKNPLLLLMASMNHGPEVTSHSIIGDSRPMLGSGWGDGVVPVSSARSDAVVSEKYVAAEHTVLHHVPPSLAEIERILDEHLASIDRDGWSPAPSAAPTAPLVLPSPEVGGVFEEDGVEVLSPARAMEAPAAPVGPVPTYGPAPTFGPLEEVQSDFVVPPFEVD